MSFISIILPLLPRLKHGAYRVYIPAVIYEIDFVVVMGIFITTKSSVYSVVILKCPLDFLCFYF